MSDSDARKARPGRPGISYAEVEDVALAILAEGGTPGYTAVHARLRRGSSKTLGDHLKTFWKKQAENESAAPTLSPNLQTAIRNEIRMQVAAVTADLAARTTCAETDRITLMGELSDALSAGDQRASEVKALETTLAARDGALAELRERLRVADEREQSSRKEIELLGAELNSAHNFLARDELADRIVARLKERLLLAGKSWTEAGTRDAEPEHPRDTIRNEGEAAVSQSSGEAGNADAQSRSAAQLPTDPFGACHTPPTSRLTIAKPGVLAVTRKLIKARGVASAAEIRTELLQSGVSLNSSTLRNLASTLSQAKDLLYDREKQGWTLRSHDPSDQAISLKA